MTLVSLGFTGMFGIRLTEMLCCLRSVAGVVDIIKWKLRGLKAVDEYG